MGETTRPTKKQREMLTFIDNFISGHGYGPSYREIQRGLGYKSVSTVANHIDNLIARGHLIKRSKSARSLELTKKGKDTEVASTVKISDEKWLIDLIEEKFQVQESSKKKDSAKMDELYVLVGSLKVLGFEDAARFFIPRLVKMTKD